MAEANSYEEQRERQVEKNKRKLEELGLHDLFAAVRYATARAMPTKPVMQRNSRLNSQIRRSGRISGLPEQPDYRPGKAQRNNGTVPEYVAKEERAYAITKAEELRDQLGYDHHTFIKPISHVYATKSDGLKIPINFRQHLPAHDERMVLVDEMNNEFDVLYFYKQLRKLGCNHRLNKWKRFAAEHQLADGDCLVFQLIGRT